VTVLGGGIDELDVGVLGHPRLSAWEDGLANDANSLAGAHGATLDEEEVMVDNTVVRESTEWSDVLLDGVGLGVRVSGLTSTDTVDLLVDLSSAMVTELTTAGDRPLDGGWMPGTDTSDLSETSMSLAVKARHTESLDHTLGTLTAGHTDDVSHLVLVEDLADGDFLLEVAVSVLDLVSDGSTVELDLHNVGLVLTELELADLGGAKNADNSAVLSDALEVALDGSLGGVGLLEAISVLAESSLLGVHPVLVEAALDVVVELLSEDSGELAHAAWGLDIADHTDDLHWWGLNDGGRLNDILLDDLLSLSALLVLDDVSHTGLVSHEGGEVDWLGGVISWEMSNATSMMAGTSLGQEGKRALSWVLELSVRH